MKIGIITFHCADNYGAVLQAFGLYNKLKELYISSEVYIVDYCPVSITKNYSLISFRSVFAFFASVLRLPLTIKRKIKFNKFRRNNFKFINLKNIDCLDYLVCGSDQIWNPKITGFVDSNYFGYINGFKGKAMAYAASDGGYFEYLDNNMLKYITNMYAVSVREPAMLPFLNNVKEDISVVLDPVFLYDIKFWEKFALKKTNKNYILIYRLLKEDQIVKDAYSLAKQKGLKVIEIANRYSFRGVFKNLHKIIITSDAFEFLSYFLYADYIFTNTFHGTAFSIILNKIFYTYKINDKQNNRIHNVLSEFQLTKRYGMYFDLHNLENINYNVVNKLVDKRKIESISFITGNIPQE